MIVVVIREHISDKIRQIAAMANILHYQAWETRNKIFRFVTWSNPVTGILVYL